MGVTISRSCVATGLAQEWGEGVQGRAGTHLAGEEDDSGQAQPAVQGVEVGNASMAVVLEDGDQPRHGKDEGHQVQARMQGLPGKPGP